MGTYLTQMFPDRVGRVILDGIYDLEKQSNQAPLKWIDTDSLAVDQGLLMWAQACVASPTNCTVATLLPNATADHLLQRIDEILDTAHRRYNGFAWAGGQVNESISMNAERFSWEYFVGNIRGALYDSRTRLVLADGLPRVAALQQNQTSKAIGINFPGRPTTQYGSVPNILLDAVAIAIYCSDRVDSAGETTEDLFKAYVTTSQRTSNLAAAGVSQNMRSHCHRFTSRAVERLPQGMNKKPKDVVLVIGSTGDPITPFQSARRLSSSAFLGSQARLLQFNAPGHGAHAIKSTCIDDVVRKFVRGTLPNDAGDNHADVVCDADLTLYGLPPASWRNTTPPTSTEETSNASITIFGLMLPLSALALASIAIF
ncbi:hypothetical protein PIIN_06904 [Serendipita indica DSM 11827]|uniref:Peptidase S33 tripeptidyl aminopeptidase-like C-terminal domain-containing protein n=1 Tax=Serendipita indica (strain DSM 11827) TaxID=1109443 RepID=G4TNQ6_SERID|nr:hypothetical protein PIIN_06904 [Serendipita indica DSM 11827]